MSKETSMTKRIGNKKNQNDKPILYSNEANQLFAPRYIKGNARTLATATKAIKSTEITLRIS